MHLVHILIDFENVQPTANDLRLIRGSQYRVKIFHGPHQNKFDADMVKALQPLGAQVEYVQCGHRGKNALDFHVAFYLGRLVEAMAVTLSGAPTQACFLIVSGDGGFDALLAHVQSLGYSARKVSDIKEALADASRPASNAKSDGVPNDLSAAVPRIKVKADAPVAATKKVEPDFRRKVICNLRANEENRPSSRKALERHIANILGKSVLPKTVQELVSGLERDGIVTISDKEIDYAIPKQLR